MGTDDPIAISLGGAADVASLRALWLEVHLTHREAMPELQPYVDDTESWRQRSEHYRALLARPATFLLLARAGEALAGYALGFVHDPAESAWIADTWQFSGRVGELESLSVAPLFRGRGIGSALLDAVDTEFETLGVHNQVIGVLPGNLTARRLYERRGYQPTWLYLSRFAGRRPASP